MIVEVLEQPSFEPLRVGTCLALVLSFSMALWAGIWLGLGAAMVVLQ